MAAAFFLLNFHSPCEPASPLRQRYSAATRKETPCDVTVATAAPLVPIRKPPTKSRSSAIFTAVAASTKYRGCFESPRPRRMAQATLYPKTNAVPPQMTAI